MSVSLRYLGGASEVGKVGALLEGSEGRLLMDYGIQPDDPPSYPLPAPDVDALLLTHAHLDHCGLVPDIASRGIVHHANSLIFRFVINSGENI